MANIEHLSQEQKDDMLKVLLDMSSMIVNGYISTPQEDRQAFSYTVVTAMVEGSLAGQSKHSITH